MAHILSIKRGTTTTTLTSGSYTINYSPSNAGEYNDYVTEDIIIGVTAATPELLKDAIGALNKEFRLASDYKVKRIGSPSYLSWHPQGLTNAVRSQLIGGLAALSSGIMDGEWANSSTDVRVSWTRQNFWEDEPATRATLWNTSGSWTTTGSASNCADSTRYNWVCVVDAIGGDLPADVSLTLKNTTSTDSTTAYIEDIYIGIGSTGSSLATYEGENAINVTTGCAVTGSGLASCSNGSYVDWSWSGTTEYNPMYWTISSANATLYGGQYYNLFMRFMEAPSADSDVKFRLSYSVGLATASETAWVPISSTKHLQYIATMRIPPYLLTDTAAALNLELWLRSSTAGAHTLKLDFVGLLPTEAGFRQLIPINSGYSLVWLNRYLTDDGFTGALTSYNAAAQSFNTYTGKGKLTLIPGQANYLYFLSSKSDQTALPSRTLNVVLDYRAKRRVL
jgi:hypothetical protein